MKILMIKNYEDAKEIARENNTVSIEAVYGDNLVYGNVVTLDHHTPQLDKAPALFDEGQKILDAYDINDLTFVLSHVDLDAIAGIINILYPDRLTKPEKESINYVDCKGSHHINDEAVTASYIIDMYNGIVSTDRLPFSYDHIVDITEYVTRIINKMFEEGAIEKYSTIGRKEREAKYEYAEKHTRFMQGNCVFIVAEEGAPFGLNACYNIHGTMFDCVLVYNCKFKSLTLSSCNEDINAKEIMQKIFGPEAGGHKGIAGTPRGKEYAIKDARAVMTAVDRLPSMFERKLYGTHYKYLKNYEKVDRVLTAKVSDVAPYCASTTEELRNRFVGKLISFGDSYSSNTLWNMVTNVCAITKDIKIENGIITLVYNIVENAPSGNMLKQMIDDVKLYPMYCMNPEDLTEVKVREIMIGPKF